jgi:putative transposase
VSNPAVVRLEDLRGLPFDGRFLPNSGRKVRSRLQKLASGLTTVSVRGGWSVAILWDALPSDTQAALTEKRASAARNGATSCARKSDQRRCGRPSIEISEEAWRHLLSILKEGSAPLPLTVAYRMTADLAAIEGWAWPSYGTVRNRWEAMRPGEKAMIRSGPKALDKTIPPMERSVAHLSALAIVNLDGRKCDFFVEWEDGEVSRPILLAIQDVYSRRMLGWRMVKTENADDTKAVILKVIDEFGIPDKLLTDNSRAFASKKISGGARTRFRWKSAADEPLGILPLVGCEVSFAIPGRGQSKPIERGFKDIAQQIDTLPEFKNSYCGNRPDAKPENFTGAPIPVAEARAIYDREIPRLNQRPGRRTEMAQGKLSFNEVFDKSFKYRPRRVLTESQRIHFTYDQAFLKPNRDTGALSKDGFSYWSAEHQDLLLKHKNQKLRVLFDPSDRSKPVVVQDAAGRTIIEALPCWMAGRFDSTEDARQFHRAKAQVKKADRASLKARKLMTAAELANIEKRTAAERPASAPPVSESKVVAPVFAPAPTAKEVARRNAGISQADRDEFLANKNRGVEKLAELKRRLG